MTRGARAPLRLELALGGALFALGVILYLPALDHAWLNYDDDSYITDNPHVRGGLTREAIAWAFSSFYLANWFPLTWISWMVDAELYGMEPAGFHATSLLLHAADGVLLFLALARMTGRAWRSAFVAAVFLAHPLHVESVAWAAARKDPLSALFFLLALLAWAGQGPQGPSRARRLCALACLALGLMAKPTVLVLPFVLLLLDAWPLNRLRRGERWDALRVRAAVVEKLPLFALVALMSAVLFRAQQSGGAVVGLDRLPLAARLGNALVAYAAYLGRAFWPAGLAVIYPHPGDALPAWQPAAAGVLLAALTAAALRAFGRAPYLAVGWLWYLVTLVPVIGLVQVGSQATADRYTYLPLIGLAIAVGWAAADLLARGLRSGAARGAVGGAAIAALCAVSSAQLRHWRDSASLFEQALRVTGANAIAHAQLGAARLAQGLPAEAIRHYREAIRLRPDDAQFANNLAWLLATAPDGSLRNPYAAVRLAERAARLTDRADPEVLDTLAASYAAARRFDEALAAAGESLALAEAAGDFRLARRLRDRLAAYRAGRAWLEPP